MNKFKCPNCEQEMYLDEGCVNIRVGDIGVCDKWQCEDCMHIYVLDWRED